MTSIQFGSCILEDSHVEMFKKQQCNSRSNATFHNSFAVSLAAPSSSRSLNLFCVSHAESSCFAAATSTPQFVDGAAQLNLMGVMGDCSKWMQVTGSSW